MIKVVRFFHTEDDGTQTESGRIELEDGKFRFVDLGEFEKDLRRGEVEIPGGRVLTFADGLEWLEGLRFKYSGSRFQATAPQDVGD